MTLDLSRLRPSSRGPGLCDMVCRPAARAYGVENLCPPDLPMIERRRSPSLLGRSAGVSELLEPHAQVVAVRSVVGLPREGERGAVHLLEAVQQHRPVLVDEEPWGDVDPGVDADAEQVPVVGTVVDRAEAESVGDGRFAPVGVAEDVARPSAGWARAVGTRRSWWRRRRGPGLGIRLGGGDAWSAPRRSGVSV